MPSIKQCRISLTMTPENLTMLTDKLDKVDEEAAND